MKNWRKVIAAVSTFALLFNSLVAPLSVLAQEVTPSPTPEITSSPSDDPAATEQPTIIPSADPTITPDVSPTDIAGPTPTEIPTPGPIITDVPSPTSSSVVSQQPENDQTTTGPPSSPAAQPTTTPTDSNQPINNSSNQPATVTTTIVTTNIFPSTIQNDFFKLITDKLDYAPTEAAIISGSGFAANKTYSLTVSSIDDPATSTTVDITTDGNGSFSYSYQLDGNYRPNYKVEVGDEEKVIAETTFTDDISPNPITNSATNITSTSATLNGTNGGLDASDHSFWVWVSPVTPPVITGTSNTSNGAYSTGHLGPVSANTAFSAPLTAVLGMPAVTLGTTYYFAAWNETNGVWNHGDVSQPFTTLPDTTPPTCTSGVLNGDGISTSVQLILTCTNAVKFVSSDTTTANGTDLGNVVMDGPHNPSAATISGNTLTLTFNAEDGTFPQNITINPGTVANSSAIANSTISIPSTSITDHAKPIITFSAISSPKLVNTPFGFSWKNTEGGTVTYGGGCAAYETTIPNLDNRSTNLGWGTYTGNFPDGVYSICSITVNDDRGNSGTGTIPTFVIDTIGPITGNVTVSPLYNNGEVNYISALSSISAPVSDAGTGVDGTSCEYSLDNGTNTHRDLTSTYVGEVCSFTNINTSDATGINVRAQYDKASPPHQGAYDTLKNVPVTLDITAPTSSITSPLTGANVNGTIAISANASDLGSGVAKVEFYHSSEVGDKIGEATTAPYTVNWNTTSVSNGSHQLWLIAYDNLGNQLNSSSITVNVNNDSTPPVISKVVTGTVGSNGWYTSDVTVTWTVTDNESTAVVDSGCGSQDFTSETTGTTSSCSASSLGGSSSDHVDLKIDKTGPTATLNVTAGTLGSNGWYKSDVTVAMGCFDSISPIVFYTSDQFQNTDTSGQVFNGLCENGAGLTTNASTLTIKLDKISPTIISKTISDANGVVIGGYLFDKAGNTATATVVFSEAVQDYPHININNQTGCPDVYQNMSHVSGNTWEYNWTIPSGSNCQGWSELSFDATDSAGNAYVVNSSDRIDVRIDNSGPSLNNIYTPGAGTFVKGTRSVEAESSDGDSGMAQVEFYYYVSDVSAAISIGTGTYMGGIAYSVNWNTTPVTDGEYYLTIKATDTLGNESWSENPILVTVDNNAPVTSSSATSNGSDYSFGTWANNTVSVTLSCNDEGSGCKNIYWCYDDGSSICTPEGIYSAPLGFTSEGDWYLRYYSDDNAGNNETVQVKEIKIDETAPAVAFSDPTPANGTLTNNNNQTFKVSLSEPVSSCNLIASNGDFENGLSGWTVGGNTALTTDNYHSANHSLQLQTGIDQGASYNYAFTTANLPGSGLINLNAWIYRTTTDSVSFDQQRIYLADLSGNDLLDLLYGDTSEGWTNVNYDISAYAGQSVRAYFAVHDDGAGDPTRMWVDDVSITGGLQGGQYPMIINGLEATLDWNSMPDANYNYYVQCTDIAGNNGDSESRSLTVDTTPPSEPSATPNAGDYDADQTVTLSSDDSGSGLGGIYYTTDGSDPDSSSSEYKGAITVDRDLTLKAIAYDNAGNASSILSAHYGIPPVISGESFGSVSDSTATITWTTDDLSTSRVVYDTVSHPDPVTDPEPDYGYAFSTIEDATKVTSHSVTITGLTASTTYYYRVISHGSPESVGSELSFATIVVAATTTTTNNDHAGEGDGLGCATHDCSIHPSALLAQVLGANTWPKLAYAGNGTATDNNVLGAETNANATPAATLIPASTPQPEKTGLINWLFTHKKVSLGILIIIILTGYFLTRRRSK